MTEPPSFDDLEPETPAGGVRRWIVIGVVALLVASMVFLAWVSGRGQVSVVPVTPAPSSAAAGPSPTATAPSPAASVAATSAPAVTPGSGPAAARLAVVEADGSLFTMDRAGNGIVRHGGSDSSYLFPAWSPDGGRIAAIAAGAAGSAIHVFPAAGAGAGSPPSPTVIYQSADEAPFYLYWSPDGQSLTFLTTEPGGLALRSAPAAGGAPSTVVREGSPMYWAWAGQRRLLVHSGGQGEGSFLGEVGAADGAGDPIEAASGGFRAPAVSSTGRYRAFAVPDGTAGLKVVVASTDGSDRQDVPGYGGAAFAFEPTGDRLAFIAATEPGTPPGLPVGPLRLLDPATGGLRTLLPGVVVAFFWSPDGTKIAAIQAPPAAEPGASSSAVPARLVDTGARAELAFVDVATGEVDSTHIVQLADLFIGQFLPFFDQYALSHRLWAPGSDAMALPLVATDGSVSIAEIQAAGGEPRTIAPGVAAFWSP